MLGRASDGLRPGPLGNWIFGFQEPHSSPLKGYGFQFQARWALCQWCTWDILRSLWGTSLGYSFLLILPLVMITFSWLCPILPWKLYIRCCAGWREAELLKDRLITQNKMLCFLINSLSIRYQLMQDLLISTLLTSLFSHIWYSPWGTSHWRTVFKTVIHQGWSSILLWQEKN